MFCYTDSGRKEKIQVPKLWKILCGQKFTKQTHKKYLHYEYPKFWLVFEFIKVMHFDTSRYVLMRFDVFWPVLIDVLKSFGKMFDNMNSGQKFTQQTHQKYLLYEYLKWKYCNTDSSRKKILCWQKFRIRECSCIMPYIKL